MRQQSNKLFGFHSEKNIALLIKKLIPKKTFFLLERRVKVK